MGKDASKISPFILLENNIYKPRDDWHFLINPTNDKRGRWWYSIFPDGQLSLSRQTDYKCRLILTQHANTRNIKSIPLSSLDVALMLERISEAIIKIIINVNEKIFTDENQLRS